MHPILARIDRIAAYLAAWLIVAILLAATLTRQGLGWIDALAFLLPVLIVYSFICLSAWYVCRAMPLSSSSIAVVLTTAIVAAVSAGALWLALSAAWTAVLRLAAPFAGGAEQFQLQTPFLFSASVLLFLLVLSVHYVALAFDAVRAAERQKLELEVLTRDAELRALRAQVDPHFLYNSLNSISALTTTDPAGARRMCLLLGDFMRNTLQVSGQNRIPMTEELALADAFLSIEQVRFGSRLRVVREIDEHAAQCEVPPLLLQPLIENAIGHGIAGLVDGGTIRLSIARQNGRVSIRVENPRDPDAPPARRSGVGLTNVRRRLAMTYPDAARFDASSETDCFRVEIDLPCLRED